MVDANLQREVILPSEKARSYKMKLEAMRRQGTRGDYDRLFKIKAVKLVKENQQSAPQVAKDLSIPYSSLKRWIRENKELGENAFPGRGCALLTDQNIKPTQSESAEAAAPHPEPNAEETSDVVNVDSDVDDSTTVTEEDEAPSPAISEGDEMKIGDETKE